jgi:hypothetical protein
MTKVKIVKSLLSVKWESWMEWEEPPVNRLEVRCPPPS